MPDDVEHISETDFDDELDSVFNDENTPLNDENIFDVPAFAPVHRSSSILALRTPHSHSRSSRDTPLRDITDQFFHPPSPSPVRVSKLKRIAPHTIEPPRRPKKPKSLAYPADPPNWLYSRSSSSLPPSSPFPLSVDHAHSTDRTATARHEYHLGTPTKASDSDPFGFVAVERALKARRAPVPPRPRPTAHISAVKSPPRSTVLPTHTHAPTFTSFAQIDAPVPTNNEDIEGLYEDEPVAGPSQVHVPVAPLLMLNSDQPLAEVAATCSQYTFPDPLRTPRKHKRRASPALDPHLDPDEDISDAPSSPSPVKVSMGAGTHRRSGRLSYTPVPKLTRAQTRAAGANANAIKPSNAPPPRMKRPHQQIPTPSTTPASVHLSSRQSTAPATPVPPRRSTRQAAVGARAKLKGTNSATSDGGDSGQMKLRSRSGKTNAKTKPTKPTTRARQPPTKPKPSTGTQKTKTSSTTAKPARGRPKGKSNTKDTKGKGKARPLENVLDLSDDTREKYEKERRERLEYFKRLEGYQIQKENVYVV